MLKESGAKESLFFLKTKLSRDLKLVPTIKLLIFLDKNNQSYLKLLAAEGIKKLSKKISLKKKT